MARTHRSKKQGGVGGRILVYFQSPWLPVTLKKGGLLVLNTWVLFDLRSYADGEAPPVNARESGPELSTTLAPHTHPDSDSLCSSI